LLPRFHLRIPVINLLLLCACASAILLIFLRVSDLSHFLMPSNEFLNIRICPCKKTYLKDNWRYLMWRFRSTQLLLRILEIKPERVLFRVFDHMFVHWLTKWTTITMINHVRQSLPRYACMINSPKYTW
jgi:hypothetical protein